MPVREDQWRTIATICFIAVGAIGPGCRRELPTEQPARIIGGSMAERLVGEHFDVTCGDCGFAFRCGVEHPPARGLAVCPNCGFAQSEVDRAKTQPGMQTAIAPQDFAAAPPQRGETVAFGEPGNASVIAVKRVLGLPGEKVAIRGGDLFINGQRVQKSLVEMRTIAQAVHDDRFRPKLSAQLPARWMADAQPSQWQASDGGYQFSAVQSNADAEAPDTPADVPLDWLRYHHWLGAEDASRRTQASPVLDDYAYDQGLARQHNAVSDLLLTCRVRWLDGGPLAIGVHDGRGELTVLLDQSENLITLRDGKTTLAEAPSSTPLVGDWFALEVAVCDGRLLVGINGELMLAHTPMRDETEPPQHVASPFAIGAVAANLEIRDLRVLRDVYYLDHHGRANDWASPSPLAADEFFLLGDNVPSSRDSRHFGPVRREAMIGVIRHVPQ
jgi:type IV secretory pathway protease TraF